MIRSGKASGFIAGADIREFTAFGSEAAALEHIRSGQRVFARLEALPLPDGRGDPRLRPGRRPGAGARLPLPRRGGRFRAQRSGLPEVQLGIHPGFGGTVRSVRLLGVRPAMNLMLTGRRVRAERALQDRPGRPAGRQRASELDEAARADHSRRAAAATGRR